MTFLPDAMRGQHNPELEKQSYFWLASSFPDDDEGQGENQA